MTTDRPTADNPVPRWLHAWAVLTACAALPLVLLGAEVTTKRVGMVDPQSVRVPWHLFTIPVGAWLERGLGYLIEHGHRTFGWFVGMCAIVLAVGMALGARRLRWAGLLALVMVSAQGILGILRMRHHAFAGPELAMVHGLFAQLVFATLVAVAVATSRAWSGPVCADPRLRRLSLSLAAAVYVQIVFGAVVRHFQHPAAQRLHALFAFVVAVIAVLLVSALWADGGRTLRRWGGLLAALLTIQVALGVEAWIGRFGSGVPVDLQQSRPGLDLVRSAHFLTGALLFSSAAGLALFLRRPAPRPAAEPAPVDLNTVGGHLAAVPVGGVA